MANALNIELKDKKVLVRDREFICKAGFGCNVNTNGAKIFGVFPDSITYDKNGKENWDVISGYEVQKVID